jgi:hypothetical protein
MVTAAITVIITDSKILFFFTVLVRFVLAKERIALSISAEGGLTRANLKSYPHR